MLSNSDRSCNWTECTELAREKTAILTFSSARGTYLAAYAPYISTFRQQQMFAALVLAQLPGEVGRKVEKVKYVRRSSLYVFKQEKKCYSFPVRADHAEIYSYMYVLVSYR